MQTAIYVYNCKLYMYIAVIALQIQNIIMLP